MKAFYPEVPYKVNIGGLFGQMIAIEGCVNSAAVAINDVWGAEEFRHSGKFPFKQGREYKVEIVCEQNRFMIYVDGEFLDYYNHRLPLSSITHLEINWDTKLSVVQIGEHSAEIDKFCKMLAEKLKRLPTQGVIEAQNAILIKVLEIETTDL